MTSEFFFIFFLSALTCVHTEISLSISAPAIVKPTQSMKMTCHVSGVLITDGSKMHAVNFVRQFAGNKMEFLAHLNYAQGTAYNPAIQSRLSLSRDTAKNEVHLEFKSLETTDSATYYCASEKPGRELPAMDIWGSGTPVTVTQDKIIPPKVYFVISNGDESYIDVGCHVNEYNPKPVIVSWRTFSGETLSGERNTLTTLSENPPSYSLFSSISVSKDQLKENNYSCTVKHFSTTIEKTMPKGCIEFPESPAVSILQESCFSNTNDQVALTCQGNNLTSQDASIKWFMNERETTLSQDLVHLGNSNNLYVLQSTVSINMAQWNNGVRVKCQMTDAKTGKSGEALARKCSDSFNCLGIEVMMLPPTIEDLYVHETARIACVAYNLKEATGYEFRFEYPGAPNTLDVQTEDGQLHQNGTYSVTSILTVTPETWKSHTEFNCFFKMTGLSNPVHRTISKKTETNMKVPRIAVFPPPQEDIAEDENCSLTCVAYDFYPPEIFIGWTENNGEVFKDEHVKSEPKEYNGNLSYSASSLLKVPCDKWKQGNRYSCVLGHEANPLKFMKKDIDKNSGNPTKVNVSLVMSDTTLSCS